MLLKVTSGELLSEFISGAGHLHNTPCGGRGVCRRCTVKLVSGEWLCGDKKVIAPAEVLSCQTRLAGAEGVVEFIPQSPTGGIADEWLNTIFPAGAGCVIGVDIGTTTVAAVKYSGGRRVDGCGVLNPQVRFGDNSISRIAAAPQHLAEMRTIIREAVENLLLELGVDDVCRIGIAGNTVMLSLFYGIDPSPIGVAPFEPAVKEFPPCTLLGIETLAVPCISGYIGGDLTAGYFCTRPDVGEMLVDMGTNCEIIFNTPGGIYCTSAAAGPAFEGKGLHCGCRAMTGAVEHYRGENDFDTVGGGEPTGICGSGYVDWLAEERKAGHLTPAGRLQPAAEKKYITDKVFIHESDISELLKAKAAIYAGISSLEKYCSCKASRIWLAGGFARYINTANAIACGMLPEREYVCVGNTSLAGALQLALTPEADAEMQDIRRGMKEIPLNTLADFEDDFIDALLLP